MKVLVLHGPNLNLLGERPGDAPTPNLSGLNRELERKAATLEMTLKILQSNHEGALVDALHAQRKWMDAVVINPSALAATSYALRDALAAVQKPAIEVHLEDLKRLEPSRRKSVLKEVCMAQITGKGVQSYLLALERLAKGVKASKPTKARGSKARATTRAAAPNVTTSSTTSAERRSAPRVEPAPAPRVQKTLGRRPVSAPPEPRAPAAKTLGKPAPIPVPAPISRVTGSQLGFITRALVQQKLADRLSGKLSPAALATWARAQWQEVQRGAPAESGQRELLEDLLQNILLFSLPPNQLSDDQLIELMTRLDG
jgi:3-dehydroquinate dehydratase-2